MTFSNDNDTKREMGYNGSNMHGYSLSKKKEIVMSNVEDGSPKDYDRDNEDSV